MDSERTRNAESPNLPVDLIRVVAVVLVILLHASIESYTYVMLNASQSYNYWLDTTIYDSLTRIAVPLFVMLSGALLLQPIKIQEPIRIFLKKRFTRLGFAFAFWSAVYFAWSHFVHNQTLSINYIIQGLLTGPYFHFWFIYLIAGLYLITPILRVIVTYGERKILRYLILLWLIGVGVVPVFQLLTGFTVNINLILIGGWIGYFVLGAYLQNTKVRTWLLFGLLVSGFILTGCLAWIMNNPLHYLGQYYFFFGSLTPNVVLTAVAMFMILNKFRPDWPGSKHPYIGKVAHAISVNSLPIYLGQIVVMESLQMGFFGFKLSLTVLNPIYEIPAITVVTLFLTLGLVLLMRQVPVLKQLIGSR